MSLGAMDRLLLKQNLVWAWRKAVHLYRVTDGLQNQEEVAAFDLDLERNLDRIARDIKSEAYKLAPLRLLPQPKSSDPGVVRSRQSFEVSVRDQVTWMRARLEPEDAGIGRGRRLEAGRKQHRPA